MRFCTAGQLMRLLICLIFICAIGSLAFEYLFDTDATVLGYLCGRTHLAECGDGGLHEVVGIGRALALGEHVGDAYALEDGTHGAAGLHAGTVACGLEDDARAAELGNLLVGDGAFVHGHADKIFLGSLDAFGDGGLHFVGLAQAPAYDAVLIADNNDGCKGERTATLGDLGDAVDGNETVLEVEVVGGLYAVIHCFCHSF